MGMAREFAFDPADGDHGPAQVYGAGTANPGKPGDYHGTKGPKARKPGNPVKPLPKGKQGGRISG